MTLLLAKYIAALYVIGHWVFLEHTKYSASEHSNAYSEMKSVVYADSLLVEEGGSYATQIVQWVVADHRPSSAI
jgi:hypothetical protein